MEEEDYTEDYVLERCRKDCKDDLNLLEKDEAEAEMMN